MMRPSCFCEFIAENQSMMQLFWTSTATDMWSVSCCVDVFRRVGRCTHSTEAVVGVCSPSTYPFTSAIPDVFCFSEFMAKKARGMQIYDWPGELG